MRPRTLIALAATVAVVGGFFAWRESQRTHADTAYVKPAFEVSAGELVQHFLDDEEAARERYTAGHGQVLQVRGTIRTVEHVNDRMVNVVLETGDPGTAVVCEFDPEELPDHYREGSEATIKGVCKDLNKDELFGSTDVLFQRCVAVP